MAELRDYPSNSNRSKIISHDESDQNQERKPAAKLEGIGPVRAKKRSRMSKFKDAFIKEDAGNVGSYLWNEILVPSFLDTVADAVNNATSMILFGDSSRGSRRRSPGSKIAYRSYYDDDRAYRRRAGRYYDEERYDYDELEFDSKDDATDVLDNLISLLRSERVVSVADLYGLAGTKMRPVDENWGWTDLRGAYVHRSGRVWMIKLPRPCPID